jgi:hypothetical protein
MMRFLTKSCLIHEMIERLERLEMFSLLTGCDECISPRESRLLYTFFLYESSSVCSQNNLSAQIVNCHKIAGRIN